MEKRRLAAAEIQKIKELSKKIKVKMKDVIFKYKNILPKLGKDVRVFPGAKIIGEVEIGDFSSVWYNSVIRGDVNYIKIGSRTNIQDNCVLHVTNKTYPLIIGNDVTIGHSVNLHGCTIEDKVLIGIGAIVLDGSLIKKESMIAAGSVVVPNSVIESHKLYAGIPAKILRSLSKDEISDLNNSAERYVKYAEESISS